MARMNERWNQEVPHFWFKQLVDGDVIVRDGEKPSLIRKFNLTRKTIKIKIKCKATFSFLKKKSLYRENRTRSSPYFHFAH